MPTYGYLCPVCGPFEAFQGMKEPALEKCPKCGGPAKRGIGGGAGIIFKGSGFYTTDYRSAEYSRKAKDDKPAAASGADKKTGEGGGSQPSATPSSEAKGSSGADKGGGTASKPPSPAA
jgi:putative FmdB family regulatory protein